MKTVLNYIGEARKALIAGLALVGVIVETNLLTGTPLHVAQAVTLFGGMAVTYLAPNGPIVTLIEQVVDTGIGITDEVEAAASALTAEPAEPAVHPSPFPHTDAPPATPPTPTA